MTVSHLYYGNKLVKANINYETYKRNPTQNRLGYDIDDQDFKELIKLMALGSKANFNYNPTDEEIKAEFMK